MFDIATTVQVAIPVIVVFFMRFVYGVFIKPSFIIEP